MPPRLEIFGPFFDGGELVDAPRLYHYAVGTTTQKDCWTDYAQNVTATQPVVGDVNGVIAVYLSGLYKLEVRSNDDTRVLAQWDIFNANQLDAESDTISVSTFVEFQAALAQIGSGAGRIKITDEIFVTSNTSINQDILTEYASGGSLNIGAGVTVTYVYPEQIIAGPRQVIFSGNGDVSFSNSGKISPSWFGVLPSATTSINQARFQKAVNSVANESEIEVPGGTYLLAGMIQITNKNGISLHGKATLQLSGAASDSYLFKKVGTLDRLRIFDFTLKGDNNAAYTQTAIGCDSGQTITNATFEHLKILDINVGISCNAHLGGTYIGASVRFNRLSNIIGTSSGQGYGIHLAGAEDCDVEFNEVDTAHRHAIYQAFGGKGVRIIGNVVRNHRNGVANSTYTSAYVIARSNDVTFYGNQNIDGWDCGLSIEHATADSRDCLCVIAANNQFINRQNAPADIMIGEQSVPTSYNARQVSLIGNQFYNDYTKTGSGNGDIIVMNGQYIAIKDGVHRRINVNGIAVSIVLGNSTYITLATDCHGSVVQDNQFHFEGPSLVDTRGVEVCSDICTIANSVHYVGKNYGTNLVSPYYLDAAQTNASLVLA